MPKRTIAILVVCLAVLLTVAVLFLISTVFPSWIMGVIAGFFTLWFLYKFKIDNLTVKEKLTGTILFSVNESKLLWQLRDDPKNKRFDWVMVVAALVGATIAACVGHALWERAAPSKKLAYLIAIFFSALSIPLLIALANPRRFFSWGLNRRIKRRIGNQESNIERIEELRVLGTAISKFAQGLQVSSSDYMAQVDGYVADHQAELLYDRKPLFQFVGEKVNEATHEMGRLEAHARRLRDGAPSSEAGTASNRMTKEQALKILGLAASATFADIKSARMEAVKKFNVDHRQGLEPHIRALVEEQFKQVNTAFDLLKTEFPAT